MRWRGPSPTLYDQLKANNQDVALKAYPDTDHSGAVPASMGDPTPFVSMLFADAGPG